MLQFKNMNRLPPMLGKKHKTETSIQMKLSAIKRGISKETRDKMNIERNKKYKSGEIIPWNKGKKGRMKNHNTNGLKKGQGWNKGKKIGFIPKMAFKKGDLRITGENNNAWKGGVTPLNRKIRGSIEYKLWRTAVFERDNYTCIWCGDNSGGNLNADHIKPFCDYPELRLAIDNGRTLCLSCHRTTDTYFNNYKKNK